MEFGKDLTHIAFALIGVATVALLVSHAQETVTIAKGGASAFGGLLGIVTLQSNYQNLFSV